METAKLRRIVDIDPYNRCLAYIEDDQITRAKRQARRIEYAAIRAIAQDQIRFVLKIKTYLANGNKDRARRLTRSLIGGLKLKYETALGIHPIPPRNLFPPPGRQKRSPPLAGKTVARSRTSPTSRQTSETP